ncbi:MAG: hypothetical protein L3J07_01115 [Candidatus Magasanikbacteria bacterium]|nr:hypothetical protein [Candidatus Magasanikbacteria bacterium]
MKFIHKNSRISERIFKKHIGKLSVYFKLLQEVIDRNSYDYLESSINCPFDRNTLGKVLEMANKKSSAKLKYIIVIGIGGSNLGTKAIYDALYGHFDILENRAPKMIFLDTNNPVFIEKLGKLIHSSKDKNEFLINAISKSGETTETIANLEIVAKMFSKKFPKSLDRFVITTDYQSKLWLIAQKKGISTLAIPQKVGGRFSVFSAVGLFPLAVLGVDIKQLLNGAKLMRSRCTHFDITKNPALQSAIILYEYYKKGLEITDTFVFNPELESLGKWYRQLLAESIGKEKSKRGKKVNAGILPIVSVGSTDLHSVGQLYLGGPINKTTTFVEIKKNWVDVQIPKKRRFPELAENITGKSALQIMTAIMNGTKIAYKKRNLPFCEVVLDELNPKSFGEFMQFKMIEIMLLGKLMDLNTFDQPNVENYKIETKKLLK